MNEAVSCRPTHAEFNSMLSATAMGQRSGGLILLWIALKQAKLSMDNGTVVCHHRGSCGRNLCRGLREVETAIRNRRHFAVTVRIDNHDGR